MNNHESSIDADGRHDVQVAPATSAASDEARRGLEGRVKSEDYGMRFDPRNYLVVERARSVSEEKWNELAIDSLRVGTLLQANEEMLKKKSIDKVTSGAEPFREGYVTKLWRDENGELHIVDGQHRVAMYYSLGKEMPVRIMDNAIYDRLRNQCG